MVYSYGSPPIGDYNYISFVRHLAPKLPADDQVFFYNGSTKWRNNHNQIPIELFRNICHWKSRRPFRKVCQNTTDCVNEQWQNALQGLNNPPYEAQSIRNAFSRLTNLGGVEVRTASALLTAWNPAEFGILDHKVLEVLDDDMSKSYSITNYLAYHNRLRELRVQHAELNNCALRQIELALWHYYPIQKTGQTDRPDF